MGERCENCSKDGRYRGTVVDERRPDVKLPERYWCAQHAVAAVATGMQEGFAITAELVDEEAL